MTANEFALRAEDGVRLLGRRWPPEGSPRARADRPRPRRTFRPLRAARGGAQRRRLRGLRQRPSRPRAVVRRPPTSAISPTGTAGRRSSATSGLSTADRRRAARSADRVPRPFDGLVHRPAVRRRASEALAGAVFSGSNGKPPPIAAARAAHRAGRALRRPPRPERAPQQMMFGELQQAVRAGAHNVRLALARPRGSRRLCRRSALRLSRHQPARDRPPRRAARPPCRRSPRPNPQGPADLCLFRREGPGRANLQGLIDALNGGLHAAHHPHLPRRAARDAERDEPRRGHGRPDRLARRGGRPVARRQPGGRSTGDRHPAAGQSPGLTNNKGDLPVIRIFLDRVEAIVPYLFPIGSRRNTPCRPLNTCPRPQRARRRGN